MSDAPVLVSVENAICHIQINRPQTKNAMNFAAYEAMTQALEAAKADDTVRVIVFSGVGGNFSSGNDLVDFAGGIESSMDIPVVHFMYSLYQCEKPLLAAVNGVAVGIGATMLMHCDLVYADNSAKFLLPFNNLGLCTEFACSYLLPRLAGRAKAMELVLLGEAFGVETACDIGLVCSVQDEVLTHTMKQAEKLSRQPPKSTALNKRLLNGETHDEIDRVMKREFPEFFASLKGEEFKEAVSAFMEKRKPDFSSL